MTFTKWTSAALFLSGMTALVGACARDEAPPPDPVGSAANEVRNADLSITPVDGACPEQCFHVVSGTGANITHIFVSADECDAPEPVDPSVRCGPSLSDLTAVRPDLKFKGGPCPHSIDRDFWFPLVGNQSDVYCCVTPDQPAIVRLAAKAKGECHQPASSDACCATPPPDGGAGGGGGAGGSGGAGGCTYTPADL
jgi:hypothetical protein